MVSRDRRAESSARVERMARAALVRVTEPGDPLLARRSLPWGPATWTRLRRPTRTSTRSGSSDRTAEAHLRLLCPGDDEWPFGLTTSTVCPAADLAAPARWGYGAAHLADRSGALWVVGSRAATSYGLHVAGELASPTRRAAVGGGLGAAYGIDAAAHRGALAAPGPTIAVLACGADVAYPRSHEALLARIAAEGSLSAKRRPVGCRYVGVSWCETG